MSQPPDYVKQIEALIGANVELLGMFDDSGWMEDREWDKARERLQKLKDGMKADVQQTTDGANAVLNTYIKGVRLALNSIQVTSGSKPSEKWVMDLQRVDDQLNRCRDELRRMTRG